MLFLLPAISMRSFAEERKNKTDQLLLTSPVSIPAIVAGKFLAELAVFALPLAAAVVMPLLLQVFGTVSLVAAYSALLGYLLLGGACLAVGTWISALTENQILAYLATFGALLVAYLMNGIQTMFTTGNLLAFIVFMIVLLVASVLVGVICKRLAAGAVVFCAGAVVLFVLFQLFNAFNCRELHSESIFCHLFKNKLMLLVVGCTFVLQVLIIQFAGAFFGTVPLGIAMWGKLFALAFSVIVLSEVIKVFARLFQKKKA